MSRKGMTRRAFVASGGILLGSLALAGPARAAVLRTEGYDADGNPIAGLVTVGGKTYCYVVAQKLIGERYDIRGGTRWFEYGDGAMAVSEEWSDDGLWHWSESDGIMARDKEVYIPDPGKWCRYDADGNMVYGWYYNGEYWVCYDRNTGAMYHGEQYIPCDNTDDAEYKWYFFNETTGAVTYGWYDLSDGRHVFYDRTTGAMLYGWQDIDGGTPHLDETTGDEIGFWVDGSGGSVHVHDTLAIAEAAVRLAVTCDGYSDPIYVGKSNVWTAISDSRAQEYISVMDEVIGQYHTTNYDNHNPAYASCSQAACAVVRATVDPDLDSYDTARFRAALDSSSRWDYIGTIESGARLDTLAQPGDILTTTGDAHTIIYIGNELVRKAYPDSDANIFEASYSSGMWPHLSSKETYYYPGGDTFRVYRIKDGQGTANINVWKFLAGV